MIGEISVIKLLTYTEKFITYRIECNVYDSNCETIYSLPKNIDAVDEVAEGLFCGYIEIYGKGSIKAKTKSELKEKLNWVKNYIKENCGILKKDIIITKEKEYFENY